MKRPGLVLCTLLCALTLLALPVPVLAANNLLIEQVSNIEGIGVFAIDGNYAYAIDDGDLIVFDGRNPTQPVRGGNMRCGEGPMQIVGSTAYFVNENCGFVIIDIRNIETPTEMSSLTIKPFSDRSIKPTDMQVVGSLVYITDLWGFLYIVDVSNPAIPVEVGRFNGEGGFIRLHIVGNLAYVTEEFGPLRIIDVSNPAAPTEVGSFDALEYPRGVYVQGHLAFIGAYDEGLRIIDVSNPAAPVEVGVFDTPGKVEDVQVVDTLVYITDHEEGLRIIDVSNPAVPVEVGFFDPPGNVWGVLVTGDLVYVTYYVRDDQTETFTWGTFILRVGDTTPSPAPVPDALLFPETGYSIDGRIREYWEQNGGLPVFGYPITAQQEERIEGRPVPAQWFERNRLELHPENAAPYDVLLGRLGADRLAQQGYDWQAVPAEAPQAGCRFFAETERNVCGDILAAWRANGLELDGQGGFSENENLALFGLPMTGLITMTIPDGSERQVQYFERARFELHPENAPPFHVQLGLLGSEVRARQ